MATLANQTISSTYDGLIKTSTDQPVPISGVQLLEDGVGNSLALSVGRANQGVTVTGTLTATSLVGTLSTAAQPNITSVGTLTGLNLDDDIVLNKSTGAADITIRSQDGSTTSVLFGDSADNNTGRVLYDHSVDEMQFWTNDTQQVVIDSSGNVGIGTDVIPFDGLRINGTGSRYLNITSGAGTTAGILFGDSNDSFDGGISYANSSQSMIFYSADSERMRLDNSGNLGIGTSSPAVEAHIANTGNVALRLESTNEFDAALQLGSTLKPAYGRVVYDTSNDALLLYANNAEKMRIDSSGNVGIGTSSPSAPLEISKTSDATIRLNYGSINSNDGEDYYGGIEFYASGASYSRPVVSSYVRAIHTRSGTDHTNSDAGLIFGTSAAANDATAAERMRIESATGNVGIGTSSPNARLSVETAKDNDAISIINSSPTVTAQEVNYLAFYGTSNASAVFSEPLARIGAISANGGSPRADLVFYTNDGSTPTENIRLLREGGITFNGDTATSNALDDYEEGFFTPTVEDNSTGGNVATATNYGHYTKIGRQVTILVSLNNINTTGLTSSNTIFIKGLPFTPASVSGAVYSTGAVMTQNFSYMANQKTIAASINDAHDYIRFAESIDGGAVDYSEVSQITSGTCDIWFTLTYFT